MFTKIGIIASAVLSISTLSQNVINKKLEATSNEINKAENEIISQNYSDFDTDDYEDEIKTNLISYYENHTSYVSPVVLKQLKNYLYDNDYSFVKYDSISPNSIGNRLDLMFDKFDGGGGGSSSQTLKPISGYTTSNISANYTSSINGKVFVGFTLTKESAVAFYNSVYSIFNTVTDIYSNISESLPYFLEVAVTSIASKLNLLIAALPTALKVIVAVVAVGLALIVAIIAWFGYHEKGFYIGLLRNGFLNWTFECGTIE